MKMNYKLIVLTPLFAIGTGCAHLNTVNSVCKNKLEVTDSTTNMSRIIEVKDANSLKYYQKGDAVKVYAVGYKGNRVLKAINMPIVVPNQDSIAARHQAERFNTAKALMVRDCPECNQR